ncbi:hypothetical protein OsccyDRAFT_1024 [Leptolyngbyaceae cyanobacterium JSC-12]|nr:hypothetical protein OsccyDRAFT_1024 [Leptolyngbyaceae cyanobacterium JSC-12]
MKKRVALAVLSIGYWVSMSLVGCNLQPQASSPDSNPTPATSETSTTSSTSKTSSSNSTSTPQKETSSNSAGSVAASDDRASSSTSSTPSPEQATGLRPPLTVEKLKNADYYFLAKGPIQLANGKYEDKDTKRIYTMDEVVAYGDINKDGIKDAVSVLKVTIPNTGDFSYLVAFVNDGGTPKNVSTEFMGPQMKVKSLKVNTDNSIQAVMDQYQPGDPECCPSLAITRTYKLKNIQSATALPKE